MNSSHLVNQHQEVMHVWLLWLWKKSWMEFHCSDNQRMTTLADLKILPWIYCASDLQEKHKDLWSIFNQNIQRIHVILLSLSIMRSKLLWLEFKCNKTTINSMKTSDFTFKYWQQANSCFKEAIKKSLFSLQAWSTTRWGECRIFWVAIQIHPFLWMYKMWITTWLSLEEKEG